jgi:hydroxyacylglutathione hydrolase
MRIITIPCLSDNYAYLIYAGSACAVVDPSEAAPVRAALAREGL